MQKSVKIIFFVILIGVFVVSMASCGKVKKDEVFPIQKGDFFESIPFEQYIETQTDHQEISAVWDIRDYGGDVNAPQNAQAINSAVSACAQAGGGTVLVRGGAYKTGTVNLLSNVTLRIDGDSALVATHNFDDFTGAMIHAENAENVKITGPGKICGEGEFFTEAPEEIPLLNPLEMSDIRTMRTEYRARIRFGKDGRPGNMVRFYNCKNIALENVILENSMCWTLVLEQCRTAEVKNIVINNNRHVANTDGIDIVGSSDVIIRHCFVSTADDGIVIKNTQGASPTTMENVTVTDCTVMSCTNAFKIGTETYGDIENVTFENCKASLPDIYPGSVSGVSIESADGSKVKNVTVRGLELNQVTCPVFIRLCNRNKFKDKTKDMAGAIENILIEDVSAENAELPMLISGVKAKGETLYIKDVTMRDIHVVYRESEENLKLRRSVPEYAKVYPENWRFEDVPAYGVWARHTDGLTLENVTVAPRTSNTRPLLAFEDVMNDSVEH